MNRRNFFPGEYFRLMSRELVPTYSFKSYRAGYDNWRKELMEKLREKLGKWPDRVDSNVEVVWRGEEDGIIKEKIIFDSEKHISVPAYIFTPVNALSDHSTPAVFCSHGHGTGGKGSVMGFGVRPDLRAEIEKHNYSYGLQLAKAGFITMSIDWRAFGE